MAKSEFFKKLAAMPVEQRVKFEEFCGHGDGYYCEILPCMECLERFIEGSIK